MVDLTVLEPLAGKLASGMQAILDSRTTREMNITAGSANAARYPEWRIMQNPFGALLRFSFANGKDEMLIHLPGNLISQIVDLHYGGDGNVPARYAFTAAERQLVERLGQRFESELAAAFEQAGLPLMRFIEASSDLLCSAWPKSRDAIAVQPFTCEGGVIKPDVISLILAVETIRVMTDRCSDEAANETAIDTAWADRMHAAAMRVRLPACTVLTRGDISFQRLLTLAPGDILPLLLPTQIPLTVAGHIFAHGSLGEANGRAALLIEKIEKELDQ